MKEITVFVLLASLFFVTQVQGLGCYSLANIPDFPEHFWGSADYLYWKIQDTPEPVPLVEEGQTVVLGGRNISNDWRSGGRFSLGCWLGEGFPINACHAFGVDVHYLFLPKASRKMKVHSSGSPGSPNYNIPFFDVVTGQEATKPLSLVGVFSGTGVLKIHNDMQGGEINSYLVFKGGSHLKYGLSGGLRYLGFNESVTFDVNSPFIADPDVWITQDKFQSQNNFYGGQLGIGAEFSRCGFSAEATLKIALGAMCEKARIKGHLLTNDFTGRTTVQEFPGGYFTMPTNSGHHSQTRFAVVPEFDLNLNYQLTDCLKVRVGYTFLYVSQMLRAGKIIDRNINPTQSVTIEDPPTATLVGIPLPKALMNSEGFWTQGVNAGVEFYF
ncbi:MAG: BBP7 family outer membrane beta-barrel protein [Parachlamydiaceae bacterium]